VSDLNELRMKIGSNQLCFISSKVWKRSNKGESLRMEAIKEIDWISSAFVGK